MDKIEQPNEIAKRYPKGYLFCRKSERLRNESRGGTVVVVRIVEPVRVELDLAVVEVEDRGVIEADIGIRRIVPTHPCHQSLKVVLIGNKVQSHF